jgi:hypothetical protein
VVITIFKIAAIGGTIEALSLACEKNSANHTQIVGLLLPYVKLTTDVNSLYKTAIRALHVGAINLLLYHCKTKIHKFAVNRMISLLEKLHPVSSLSTRQAVQAKEEIYSLLQEFKKNEQIFSLDCAFRYLSYLA